MATAILSWAGKSFASGVVGAAGGMAFTQLLEYMGMSQPTTEILNKLNEMSRLLDGMALGIGQLNKRVEELSSDLKISTLKIQNQIQKTGVYDALANIHTHTIVPPVLKAPSRGKRGKALMVGEPTIISMADIIEKTARGELVNPELQKIFFSDVLRTWDIPRAVKVLNLGLVGESYEDGVLVLQTSLSIEQMGVGDWNPSLMSHYEALEHRFLSYLATQMAGVYLVMAAMCYGAATGTIPTEAERYLWKDFVPNMLQPELDRFLWCAEKLALSQGPWRSPWPTDLNSTYLDAAGRRRLKGGIGAPPELAKILLRSELIARRVQETFRDMRTYQPKFSRRPLDTLTEEVRSRGYYVHRLSRETAVQQNHGAELTPWPNSGSKGRSLPPTGTLIPHWNSATGNFAKLAKPETSRLRVVRYFWPLIDNPGTDFAKSFTDALPPLKTYTQEQLAAIGLDWYGFFASQVVDQSNLFISPPFDAPSKGIWKTSPLTGTDHTNGVIQYDRMDKPLMCPVDGWASSRATFVLTGTQIQHRYNSQARSPQTLQARMEAPIFRYEGLEPRSIQLHLWMSLGNSRNRYYDSNYHINGKMTAYLKTPTGDVDIYDTDRDGRMSLWDWNGQLPNPHLPPQNSDDRRITKNLKLGESGKPEEYSLVLVAQVTHLGNFVGAAATISCVVKECSLSWVAGPSPLSSTKRSRSRAK
jgi:hypothetical protein